MATVNIPTNGEASVTDARLLAVYALESLNVQDPKSLPEVFHDPIKFGKYKLTLLEKVLGNNDP